MNRKTIWITLVAILVIALTFVVTFKNKSGDLEEDLSDWIGFYEYHEMQMWGTEDGFYFARIYVDGMKVTHEMKATVTGDNLIIDLVLEDYVNGNSVSVNKRGDLLFTLSKSNNQIILEWQDYQIPDYDDFTGKNGDIEKLADNKYETGSDEWVIKETFTILSTNNYELLKQKIQAGNTVYYNVSLNDDYSINNYEKVLITDKMITKDSMISLGKTEVDITDWFETYLSVEKIPLYGAGYNNAFSDSDLNKLNINTILEEILIMSGDNPKYDNNYIFGYEENILLLASFSDTWLLNSKWIIFEKMDGNYKISAIIEFNYQ